MATSSAMSTNNTYIKYTISVTQNSQSTTNNTSNVTVSVRFYRTNTGYTTYGTGTVYCKINGTTYSAAVTSSQKITNSGIVLFAKTLNISHDTNGAKTLTCSAWINHNVVTSTEQSYSQTLTTIPRKSTLSVSNGTLGTAQTLKVTRQSSSFTHGILAICGTNQVTVCAYNTTATSISFTPPITWASQNPSSNYFTVIYTIITYSGSTVIGSTTYSKTCAVPASVKPSCSLSISDANGYTTKYGAYIKNRSKIHVTVSATKAYGSDISSYSTQVCGSTYTGASFTSNVIPYNGTVSVTSIVTDTRGRVGTATKTISVLDYSAPVISKLTVGRYNEDGISDDGGSMIKATFSCNVTALSNKNSATYLLEYKKTNETTWTNFDISSLNGSYSVTDSDAAFTADTGSSYDVRLTVTDNFGSTMKATSASTAFTLIHFKADGTGMGLGKISELSNVLDIGFQTRLNGGILYPTLPDGTDLNNVTIPNDYSLKNVLTAGYVNVPIESGTGTLTVESCGDEGQIRQIVTTCSKTSPDQYERYFYSNLWGAWRKRHDWNGGILWYNGPTGGLHMNGSQHIDFSENISDQRNGIVLVFCKISGSTVSRTHFNSFFVHKWTVVQQSGRGHMFTLSAGNTFGSMGCKYLYINDSGITGDASNTASGTGTSGIKYNNSNFVLHAVIGV